MDKGRPCIGGHGCPDGGGCVGLIFGPLSLDVPEAVAVGQTFYVWLHYMADAVPYPPCEDWGDYNVRYKTPEGAPQFDWGDRAGGGRGTGRPGAALAGDVPDGRQVHHPGPCGRDSVLRGQPRPASLRLLHLP